MRTGSARAFELDSKSLKKFKDQFGAFAERYEPIYRAVRDLTMIGRRGVYANLEAVDYICGNSIPGSIVECGVWRGGSVKAMVMGLTYHGQNDRKVYLFDTFEGMVEPGEHDAEPSVRDKSFDALRDKIQQNSDQQESGSTLIHRVWRTKQQAGHNDWCFASIEEVRSNLSDVDYPEENLHFIKGDDRKTVPAHAESIGPIALLRLDTDWHDSTRVELEHLYDRVVSGGVVIIDDYGYWSGQKKAVDTFFASRGQAPLLTRIDATKRMMIKV